VRLRLRLLFALLVTAPLVALAALGVWAARNQEARAEREIRDVLARKLADVAAGVDGALAELEGRLLVETERLPADADALRAHLRQHPRLRHLLVLDARARLRFPPPDGPVSDDERRFVDESRDLWERGALSHPPRDERTGRSPPYGWQPASGADGFGLFFWRRLPAGERVAILIPSATLLGTLIARLPDTAPPPSPYDRRRPGDAGADADPPPGGERIALEDPAGKIAYEWGSFEPRADAEPVVTRGLGAPLGGWRLAYLGPTPAPGRATVGIVAGLCALGAVIAGAAIFLYRESTRELRLASRRVSFVNQVSHELKTPLTNIRLYAELLEDHVAADDDAGQQRLAIVVAESQRLGRLINNILTFSRHERERGHLALHPTPVRVDDVVAEVVAQFAPGFAARGVTVDVQAGAAGAVRADGDALRQMLGNVLGNVEKYAPGGAVVVRTDGAPPLTTITVHDSGPGIPAPDRDRIFEPFVRLGGAAHEGVPGTGIGLGIARDLARLHGGDLRLLPSARGACFQLTLRTEAAA
jgi:signal transduction histidine kinase